MTQQVDMKTWLAKLRGQGPIVQSASIGLAVAGAYALVAPFAAWHSGPAGMMAAAAAALFCLLGALAALVLARRFREPDTAWQGMLWGMLPRMGVPFLSGIACQLWGGVLAQAGVLVYLVVFYPVALWAETVLCLPVASGTTRPSQTSRNVAL